MRIKFNNRLLQISNFIFIFFMVISIILITNNFKNIVEQNYINNKKNIIYSYIPFIIGIFLSLITASFFVYYKKKYFELIFSHITTKTIFLFKSSIFLLFFNILLAIILMFFPLFFLKTNASFKFYLNYYIFIVLAIMMLLTLVDILVDSVSILKIKVDLANKRYGNNVNEI